jgi:hypothetical protein
MLHTVIGLGTTMMEVLQANGSITGFTIDSLAVYLT